MTSNNDEIDTDPKLQTLVLPFGDNGYCGLDLSPGPDLETGKWDPFWIPVCKPHDAAFDELKAGKPSQTNFETLTKFTYGVAAVAVRGAVNIISAPVNLLTGDGIEKVTSDIGKGVYSIVASPIYFTVGGLLGSLRWKWLEWNLEPSPS